MQHSWVVPAAVVVVGVVAAACAGAPGGGETSSGGASGSGSSGTSGTSSGASGSGSSSSGGSSSGAITTTTTCAPDLQSTYFDGATAKNGDSLAEAPCPDGFRPKPRSEEGLAGNFPPPKRYGSEAALVSEHCDVDPSDGGAGGRAINYSTHDVVAVVITGFGGASAPMLARGDELWVRRTHNQCSGAPETAEHAFYVVPKGKELMVQSCQATCTCNPPPCMIP